MLEPSFVELDSLLRILGPESTQNDKYKIRSNKVNNDLVQKSSKNILPSSMELRL